MVGDYIFKITAISPRGQQPHHLYWSTDRSKQMHNRQFSIITTTQSPIIFHILWVDKTSHQSVSLTNCGPVTPYDEVLVYTGSGMVCCLFSAKWPKPLLEPMLTDYQLDLGEQTSMKFESKYKIFSTNFFFENVYKNICLFSGFNALTGGLCP